MSQLPNHPPDRDVVADLRRQLNETSKRIAQFEVMGVELKLKPRDAHVADMIRINEETILTCRRSAELLTQRLKHAEAAAGNTH